MSWSPAMADFIEESSRHHFLDRYNRGVIRRMLQAWFAHAGCVHLDLGCGSGYMLEEITAQHPGTMSIGSDYEERALAGCRRQFPQMPLLRMNALEPALHAGAFDVVTCLNVLEHIEQDGAALAQMHALLKPGGALGISVPLGPELYDLYDETHGHVPAASIFLQISAKR